MPSEVCVADCEGVWGGAAELDACKICGGTSTDTDACNKVSASVSLPEKVDGSQYACSEVVQMFADALADGDTTKITGIDETTGLCTSRRRAQHLESSDDSRRRRLQLMVEFPFVVAMSVVAAPP
eukprot:COSAG06_NODE_35821_length_455_cov_0.837079_1_plen_124_part_10